MLRCSSCKKDKEESAFALARSKSRGYAWSCKECKKEQFNKKKAETPHDEWYQKSRNHWLKSQYGISVDDYNQQLKEQDHKCAICKLDETEVFRSLLYVDHCHETGRVRGLLCHHCNTALGKFKESEEILSSAIRYVKEQQWHSKSKHSQ